MLRLISTFDDYFTWIATMAPLLTGMALIAVPSAAGGRRLTYHDACKLGRHGGVLDEPRAALRALGVDFRETGPKAELNWCCGGGAAVFLIKPRGRSAPEVPRVEERTDRRHRRRERGDVVRELPAQS